jgi:hypothetical protein
VTLTVRDGSSFQDVVLVSAGRAGVTSLWLDVGGMDVFLPQSEVVEARDFMPAEAA